MSNKIEELEKRIHDLESFIYGISKNKFDNVLPIIEPDKLQIITSKDNDYMYVNDFRYVHNKYNIESIVFKLNKINIKFKPKTDKELIDKLYHFINTIIDEGIYNPKLNYCVWGDFCGIENQHGLIIDIPENETINTILNDDVLFIFNKLKYKLK